MKINWKIVVAVFALIFTFSIYNVSIWDKELCQEITPTSYDFNYSGTYVQNHNVTIFSRYSDSNKYWIYICEGNRALRSNKGPVNLQRDCEPKGIVERGVTYRNIFDNATFELNSGYFIIEEHIPCLENIFPSKK